MPNFLFSIDGACRRNGQPNCTSAGGVFIIRYDHFTKADLMRAKFCTCSSYERESTNQRGEMHALLQALTVLKGFEATEEVESVIFLTDSEYLFNTMTKEWYKSWASKGWLTKDGMPVKNKDLWMRIIPAFEACSTEIHFMHIKGHCIPFGVMTAGVLLDRDPSGETLFGAVCSKYDTHKATRASAIAHAQEVSERNNGGKFDESILRGLIAANIVADALATQAVNAADVAMRDQQQKE